MVVGRSYARELRGQSRVAATTRKEWTDPDLPFSYRRLLELFDQVAIFHPQMAPLGVRPRSFAHSLLGFEERPIARICPSRKVGRIAVFNDAPVLDHQRARKCQSFTDIVGDAY